MNATFKEPMGNFLTQHAEGLWKKEVTPWVMVVDNFVPNPDEVRRSALTTGFGTWRPTNTIMGYSSYDGVNINGLHAPLIRALTQAMKCPIYPSSMIFRVTGEKTDPARVHSDRTFGHFSCIVYLSKEAQKSGTAFYRHIDRDSCEQPALAEMLSPEVFESLDREMTEASASVWDPIHYVEGKYNRAIIFKAPLYHSRIPRLGTGTTPENSRMVWVTHFNVESNYV